MSRDKAHAASGNETCRTLYQIETISKTRTLYHELATLAGRQGTRSHGGRKGKTTETHLRWKQCNRSSMAQTGP